MIRRTLMLALVLTAGTAAYGQCGAVRESKAALNEIHGASQMERLESHAVIEKWLPVVRENLSTVTDPRWFRTAMAMERELQRHGRDGEAREILELVASSKASAAAHWQKIARKRLDSGDRPVARVSEGAE
jgi:hypothetical protein